MDKDNSQEPPRHDPHFTERTPENLEKYIELVEELQNEGGSDTSKFEANISNMDFEEKTQEKSQNPRSLFSFRNRTPNRLRYETEVEVIKKQIGDLESIRQKLGLSRRKICQLLMVDPSAWSRWSKEGAPPHIYRALEWYILLTKEAPAHAHAYWITTVGGQMRHNNDVSKAQVKKIEEHSSQLENTLIDLQLSIEDLKAQTQNQQNHLNKKMAYFGITLLILVFAIGFIALRTMGFVSNH